jgi:hypothetical protein
MGCACWRAWCVIRALPLPLTLSLRNGSGYRIGRKDPRGGLSPGCRVGLYFPCVLRHMSGNLCFVLDLETLP